MKKGVIMRNIILIVISFVFLGTTVGCESIEKKESWTVCSTFTLPVTFGDGTEGEYLLIGKEGKVGFLVGSGKKGEAVALPMIANKVNKYMWHFWGDKNTLSGDFKVVGIDEKGKEHRVLIVGNDKVWGYASDGSISPINGADSHYPANMVFPTSGLWKLAIYFNEKLFDEIVIKVEDS